MNASEKDLPVLSELRFSKIDHCVASYGGVSGEGRKLPYAFAQPAVVGACHVCPKFLHELPRCHKKTWVEIVDVTCHIFPAPFFVIDADSDYNRTF